MKKVILLVFLLNLIMPVFVESTVMREVPTEEFFVEVKGISSAKVRFSDGTTGGRTTEWKLKVVWNFKESKSVESIKFKGEMPKKSKVKNASKIEVSINGNRLFTRINYKDVEKIEFEEYPDFRANDKVKVVFSWHDSYGNARSKVIEKKVKNEF